MRLTKKDSVLVGEYDYIDELDNLDPIVNKLGELEDIEEELGVNLIVFFRIRKHCNDRKPIFIKDKGEIIKSDCRVELCYKSVAVHTGDYGADSYPLKDYGKTWALTKEELK